LEGAREAGTKTYSDAIVKQKTAVPQGAASLSLAVLESDGRKGEVVTDNGEELRNSNARQKHVTRDIRQLNARVDVECERSSESAVF
jgi:hypothetical protein